MEMGDTILRIGIILFFSDVLTGFGLRVIEWTPRLPSEREHPRYPDGVEAVCILDKPSMVVGALESSPLKKILVIFLISFWMALCFSRNFIATGRCI